ncbi:hypothetical protein ACIQI7_38395 [Kitasatospora sp. NPDC092039]|uniref:hypothetical protein n=1 Tax=Kitasatospora sp. NPDC092039 TaxID=3364086 RepID=UPI003818059D
MPARWAGLGEGRRVVDQADRHPLFALDQEGATDLLASRCARVCCDVSVGTLGVITHARPCLTPWPYVVAFDGGPECAVRDQSLTLAHFPVRARL